MSAVALPDELKNPEEWLYLTSPVAFATNLRQRQGVLAKTHFAGDDFAVVLSAEAALQVFAQIPDNYDAFFHDTFAGLAGEGSIYTLMGKELRQERKLFAPAVHPGHFRAHGEVIREIAQQHFASWQVGQTVKAIDATKTISLDVIMRLVFGVEDEQIMEEGRAVLDEVSAACHPAIMFFSKLQHPSFPLYKKYLDAKATMYEWACRLIALRRSRTKPARCSGGYDGRKRDGQPVSERTLQRIDFDSSPHVTTGSAISWVLYGRTPSEVRQAA